MGGFTYNGTHSSSYGVTHVETPGDRWFESPDFEIYQTDIPWHSGGTIHGKKVKIREFSLNCFFEQISIMQREQIRKWLGRETSGNLMFDDMPFVYWKVTPEPMGNLKLYNDHLDANLRQAYSGTFTAKFLAADPFGYLTRKSNGPSDHDNAHDYCSLIPTSQMPAAPAPGDVTFDVYNPGTERCGLRLIFGGTATKPFRFLNDTNKTKCTLTGLPTGSLVLDVRSETGLITTHPVTSELNEEKNWAFHDGGFVWLEPGTNHIIIEEKSATNTWVTPTGLSLTNISIDYAPRIL